MQYTKCQKGNALRKRIRPGNDLNEAKQGCMSFYYAV